MNVISMETGRKTSDQQPVGARSPRPWPLAISVALSVVCAGVALSATINPLLDRRVHWDWTAGLATASFLIIATAVRRRWM